MSRLGRMFRSKIALANIGLVSVLLLGGGYLVVEIMRVSPLRRDIAVTVNMDVSGGLQPGNDVTFRGYRVGKVSSIDLTEKGIVARAVIDANYHIPANGRVSVQALSGAGEQYIDFRPETDNGPYLTDGSVIESRSVSTPTPVSTVLDNSSALISQVDPAKFGKILNELDVALSGGPDQLRGIVNAISVLSVGMDNLLPQTKSLLTSLRTIAGTTAQAQPDLATLTRNSATIFRQTAAADQELQRFLDQAPGQLASIGATVSRNSDPMTNLAQNLSAITRASQVRKNALALFLPRLALGLNALAVPVRDGEFNTVLDIWLRPTGCRYDTEIYPPSKVQDSRVPLWNYCQSVAPGLLIRGAPNAPRPPGPNNGAGMKPGVDPRAKSFPVGTPTLK